MTTQHFHLTGLDFLWHKKQVTYGVARSESTQHFYVVAGASRIPTGSWL